RYDGVRQRLAAFPTRNVPERIQADLRELRGRLASEAVLLTELRQALEQTMREAVSPTGKSLASAVTVLLTELHPATAGRLDAFLGQFRDVQRRRAREEKPTQTPEQLLSLAVSGWLLGSPSA